MRQLSPFLKYWNRCLVFHCILLCNVFHSNNALYEDQIGKFDWRQQYIGNVISAHFEHNVGNHKIIVATEENVIAALNPRTNQTIWRQLLESKNVGKIHSLVSNGNNILTVSGDHALVRSWDSSSGMLKWEVSLMDIQNEIPPYRSLYQFRIKDSSVVVAELMESKHINFKKFNYQTGDLMNSQKIPASWLTQETKCQFVSESLFICINGFQSSPILYTFDIERDNAFLPSSLSDYDSSFNSAEVLTINNEAAKRNLVLIKSSTNEVIVLEKTEKGLKLLHKFSNVILLSTVNTPENEFLCLLFGNEVNYQFKVFSLTKNDYLEEVGGSIVYPSHHGVLAKMFADISLKKDGSYTWRILLTTSSHSVLYFNGEHLQWTREESLASILSVEMVELPISESEAQMEEQFGNVNANILVLFLKRLSTQLIHLQGFLAKILLNIHGDARSHKSLFSESDKLIRDEFDIHKMIVIVTSPGKIFGMDSLTGKIIWRTLVSELQPFQRFDKTEFPLHVLRTTAHYSYSPQCAVIGSHKKGGTVIYVFNPITGEPVGDKKGINIFSYNTIQAMQLTHHDSEFIRGILIMDSNYKMHAFPESCHDVAYQIASSLYMFVADRHTGELTGFNLALSTSKELISSQIWKLVFQADSQKITNVVMKRKDEHVHSQGRVMGDRSVLYKYLNPNLAVVTTESIPAPHQSSLNVYLVDVVSGQIVFSANHKRAKGPVHVVHSENWVVYSYLSEKFRRMEVSVFELYEGKTQSNTTYFSSLSPPVSPMVERQAYIFYTQINSLAVTITQKGITAKHLLFALPGGGILELPKAYLDPRRSLFPTAEHREEGIIPYNPELPISTENIINYNQSLYGVRGMYTAPTGLESTCLVLAYGLDLFYTRVTPSRTFDVLKEDFDHWIIVMALTGLLVASYATKKLAAKKALKQAWK